MITATAGGDSFPQSGRANLFIKSLPLAPAAVPALSNLPPLPAVLASINYSNKRLHAWLLIHAAHHA
jgi:hypothetical protein